MNPSKKSKQNSSNKLQGVLVTNTKLNKNIKYILKVIDITLSAQN